MNSALANNKSVPDHTRRNLKLMYVFVCIVYFGLLLIEGCKPQEPSLAANCYVDTMAFKINTYMLYGKVSSYDTVYEKKCFVNK